VGSTVIGDFNVDSPGRMASLAQLSTPAANSTFKLGSPCHSARAGCLDPTTMSVAPVRPWRSKEPGPAQPSSASPASALPSILALHRQKTGIGTPLPPLWDEFHSPVPRSGRCLQTPLRTRAELAPIIATYRPTPSTTALPARSRNTARGSDACRLRAQPPARSPDRGVQCAHASASL
jgi:hypothetical protein